MTNEAKRNETYSPPSCSARRAHQRGKDAAAAGGRHRCPYAPEQDDEYSAWMIGYTEHLLPNATNDDSEGSAAE